MKKHNWNFGISVRDILSLAECQKYFDKYEINLKRFENIDELIHKIVSMKKYPYSVHCRYGTLEQALADIKLARIFKPKVCVVHLDYPQNEVEFKKQIKLIDEQSKKNKILVCVENLSDRAQKTNYDGAKNPEKIVEYLDILQNKYLGFCLDTGHAMKNGFLNWNTPLVKKWLKHVHYHSTTPNCPEKDLHLPVIGRDYEKIFLLKSFFKFLSSTENEGVIIFENKTVSDSLISKEFLKENDYL
jgi:sugar phosphate isomerase/epimerase